MYCTNCGAEVDPNGRFCTSCGADLEAQRASREVTTVPPEETKTAIPTEGATTVLQEPKTATGVGGQFDATAQPTPEYPATARTAQWVDQTQLRQDVPYAPTAVPSPPQQTYEGPAHPKRGLQPVAIVGIVAAVAVAGAVGLGVAGIIPNPFAGIADGAGAVTSSSADTGSSSNSTGSNATGSTSANGSSSSGTSNGTSNGTSSSASNGSSTTSGSSSKSSSSQSSSAGGTSKSSTTTQHVGFKGITNATSSSTLAPDKFGSYGPLHLLDGDPTTCWSEGVDGLGVGESITLRARSTRTRRYRTSRCTRRDRVRWVGPRPLGGTVFEWV
ncbi:MAG: zinc ribbon domain-containing protein [Atopobiaceae bacterium]